MGRGPILEPGGAVTTKGGPVLELEGAARAMTTKGGPVSPGPPLSDCRFWRSGSAGGGRLGRSLRLADDVHHAPAALDRELHGTRGEREQRVVLAAADV